MTDNLNPHAKQMADESMIRNLAAQAEAIWPEKPLFERYALPVDADVLDAGCGTGEISLRLAQAFPHARVLGVDIIEEHMEFARRRSSAHGERLRFENRSIFELGLPDRTFDLVVCRHVLQTIPYVERAVAELARVTRRGGWIHILVEDHLMIHFEARRLDPDDFWSEGPRCFSRSVGADLRAGRRLYGILQRQGLVDITVDYIVVDPLRVPRTTFAEIWGAWRDGYAEAFGANTPISSEKYRAHFDDMIDDSGSVRLRSVAHPCPGGARAVTEPAARLRGVSCHSHRQDPRGQQSQGVWTFLHVGVLGFAIRPQRDRTPLLQDIYAAR